MTMNGEMNQPCTCSIVIRAYNEAKHIGRLLTGIKRQSLKDVEIILVDSGSTDETVEIGLDFGARVVSISPEEFTFGRALNRGVAAGVGKFIVNISAHCYPVFPDWLERLLEPFKDESVGLCYGKQRGGETNHYSEHQIFRKYFPDISQPRQGNPYSHNANAAVRRVLWERHPYNENVTGLEDLAWSSWLQEKGYEIAYVAEAEVVHQHDEQHAQVLNRYHREAVALKQILPQSRFTFRNFMSLWLGSTFSDIVQSRRDGVFWREVSSIIWFRLVQYLGTYRGYNFSGKIDAQLHRTFYYPPNILDEKNPVQRGIQPIDYDENV